jgi:hypothetical protein
MPAFLFVVAIDWALRNNPGQADADPASPHLRGSVYSGRLCKGSVPPPQSAVRLRSGMTEQWQWKFFK